MLCMTDSAISIAELGWEIDSIIAKLAMRTTDILVSCFFFGLWDWELTLRE